MPEINLKPELQSNLQPEPQEKTVFATFQGLDLRGNVTEKPVSLTVPIEQEWKEWLYELEELAEQIGYDSDLVEVVIKFRLDGTNKPATWLEQLQHFLHAQSIFGSRLVPIWSHAGI